MGKEEKNRVAKTEKLWTLSFVLITIISFLGSMNGNGITNGIAVLVEAEHLPATLVGEITFSFCIAALLARFAAGHLSDEKGRRLVVELGAIALGIGCIISLILANLKWLILSRAFMGFGFSMIATACAAAVADVVPRSRVGEGLGYQGLSMALSMALGPSFAMALANAGGRIWLMGAFLVLAVVAYFLAKICPFGDIPQQSKDEKREFDEGIERSQDTSKKSFLDKTLWVALEKASLAPAIVVMASSVSSSLYVNFTSLTALERGLSGAGLFFIITAVVMIVVRFACAKFFDRPRAGDLIFLSAATGAGGLLCILFAQGITAFVIAGVLNGISSAMMQPILMADAIRRAPDTRRGAASATYYVGCDIAVGLGSLLWGTTIEYFGYTATYLIGCGFFALCAVLYLVLIRNKK